MSEDSIITKNDLTEAKFRVETAFSESTKQFYLYWNIIKIMFA